MQAGRRPGHEGANAAMKGANAATKARTRRCQNFSTRSEMIWLYSRWMSDTELAPQSSADPAPIPALGPPSYPPDPGWVVTRHDDVCAVLSDPRYEVGAAASTAPVGTIS